MPVPTEGPVDQGRCVPNDLRAFMGKAEPWPCMVPRLDVALGLTVGIGAVSFLLLDAWLAVAFEGQARTALLPILVVFGAASAAAEVLGRRLDGRCWPGPAVVAVAWFAQWQYLLEKSLMVHG